MGLTMWGEVAPGTGRCACVWNGAQEKDKQDIMWGSRSGMDFLAVSFCQSAADVRHVREFLGRQANNVKIIAKIENQQGVDEIEDIISEADGVMVARGDLGMEVPLEKLINIQVRFIPLAIGQSVGSYTYRPLVYTNSPNQRDMRYEWNPQSLHGGASRTHACTSCVCLTPPSQQSTRPLVYRPCEERTEERGWSWVLAHIMFALLV